MRRSMRLRWIAGAGLTVVGGAVAGAILREDVAPPAASSAHRQIVVAPTPRVEAPARPVVSRAARPAITDAAAGATAPPVVRPAVVAPAHPPVIAASAISEDLLSALTLMLPGARTSILERLPSDEQELLALLDGPPALALVALERLVALGARGTVPRLLTALTSDLPLDVRQAVASAVGKLADEGARAPLLDLLGPALRADQALPIADAALAVLGHEGPGVVLAAARDPRRDPATRAALLRSFVLVRDREEAIVPGLLEGLRDVTPEVRRSAALALVHRGDGPHVASAVAALAERLERDPDVAVRAQAARALGTLHDPAARVSLENAARDAAPDVRVAACCALADL